VIFIDASALIAVIARESQAESLSAILEVEPMLGYSPIAAWETVAGLCRSYRLTADQARENLERLADELHIRMLPLGPVEYGLATEAFKKYGKGRHRAALNMGDCFAYACAKANRAKLLFIGDDFGHTDIAIALRLQPG
jgi:ribonuclease VapC